MTHVPNSSSKFDLEQYQYRSDDVSNILWVLRDFVPECCHAKFGGNWTTNKGEAEGGGGGGGTSQPIFY